MKVIVGKRAKSNGAHCDVRKLRARAKRITANKKASLRLLAATGMYTLKGDLKPQFR